MKGIFSLLFICCTVYLYSLAGSTKIDSLLNELKTAKEDTSRVNIMNGLFLELEFYDTLKAKEYVDKALETAIKSDYKKGVALSFLHIGFMNDDKGNYNISIENYFKALNIYKKISFGKGIAKCYKCIGLVHRNQGSYDQAIEHFSKSLKIKEEFGSKEGIANTLGSISNLNISLSDSAELSENQRIHYLKEAVKYGRKSFELAKEIGAIPRVNQAAEHLQKAYKKLGNTDKALEYAEIFIETKDILYNEEKTKAITEMETKYQAEKKQMEIEKQKILLAKKDAETKRKIM